MFHSSSGEGNQAKTTIKRAPVKLERFTPTGFEIIFDFVEHTLEPAGIQISLDLLVPKTRPKLVEPVGELRDLRQR